MSQHSVTSLYLPQSTIHCFVIQLILFFCLFCSLNINYFAVITVNSIYRNNCLVFLWANKQSTSNWSIILITKEFQWIFRSWARWCQYDSAKHSSITSCFLSIWFVFFLFDEISRVRLSKAIISIDLEHSWHFTDILENH